ncbi:hypothetical protein FVEG_10236 [Fusarium verticillioides 7600]|uniref:Uncharacterized protein n=1 Tax=Gibberella moniliformis (strain M3125 / FGSC 7600) TaxID=334819 RepID=W7MJE5_GIBM7|nr:hypothetical protein FVEG_10236 [Fusarium verticillioides 7600]EWG51156.1 hypothetical protein FVEG_10236 [Fusarium verticillioides 7600]
MTTSQRGFSLHCLSITVSTGYPPMNLPKDGILQQFSLTTCHPLHGRFSSCLNKTEAELTRMLSKSSTHSALLCIEIVDKHLENMWLSVCRKGDWVLVFITRSKD